MNSQDIAPWLTLLGVLVSLLITGINNRKINAINTEMTLFLEKFKAKEQLRIAAIDRRLQTHQESFVLWHRLRASISSVGSQDVVHECQNWWQNNCLYLEPEVRQAFLKACAAAQKHLTLADTDDNSSSKFETWCEINEFSAVLFESIKLPPLSEFELKESLPFPEES